jgi:hypothetical protein
MVEDLYYKAAHYNLKYKGGALLNRISVQDLHGIRPSDVAWIWVVEQNRFAEASTEKLRVQWLAISQTVFASKILCQAAPSKQAGTRLLTQLCGHRAVRQSSLPRWRTAHSVIAIRREDQ